MNKYVVLSINENPQYIFYLPLVVWAWKKFGWGAIIFYAEGNRYFRVATKYIDRAIINSNCHRLSVEGDYKSETIAQISRLYASSLYGRWDDFLMTSDVDMLPLSGYWGFDERVLNIWGHDLTNFQHVPICYIGAIRARWNQLMDIGPKQHNYNSLIERDLKKIPNSQSHDSVKRWVIDQDWVTEKINQYPFEKKMFHRGTLANGYPKGRVDRSAWTLEHPEFIDCHMLRDIWKNPDHLARTMLLLFKIWPQEDFTWFREYTQEFAKEVGNA